MPEPKYTRVPEAEVIIDALHKKYPKVFWTIGDPKCIAVLGIENIERPKTTRTLASIQKVPPMMKVLMIGDNASVTHIIKLYWTDWHKWSAPLRQAILAHECLHIPSDDKGVFDHDVKDFRIILDVFGLGWQRRTDLPDLLKTDVKFDENLIPSLPEEGGKK
jgi:hypothetical protein